MMFQAEEQSSKLKAGRDGRQEARQGNIESRQRNTNRTTKLLIVILVLFLIAEFPLVLLLIILENFTCFLSGDPWNVFSHKRSRFSSDLLQPDCRNSGDACPSEQCYQ